MGPQCVDTFLHKIYRENLLKIKLVRKAATCMEASRGSVDLSLFTCEPRGYDGATMGVKFLLRKYRGNIL